MDVGPRTRPSHSQKTEWRRRQCAEASRHRPPLSRIGSRVGYTYSLLNLLRPPLCRCGLTAGTCGACALPSSALRPSPQSVDVAGQWSNQTRPWHPLRQGRRRQAVASPWPGVHWKWTAWHFSAPLLAPRRHWPALDRCCAVGREVAQELGYRCRRRCGPSWVGSLAPADDSVASPLPGACHSRGFLAFLLHHGRCETRRARYAA